MEDCPILVHGSSFPAIARKAAYGSYAANVARYCYYKPRGGASDPRRRERVLVSDINEGKRDFAERFVDARVSTADAKVEKKGRWQWDNTWIIND